MTRTERLELTGMSCANCSGTIEDSVGALDGVESVNANFATDEGSVTYDPDVVSLADIVDAVHDAGYGVRTESVTVAITDMSCANCSQTVTEALHDTPGVIEADVNFATDEGRVTYNPAEASIEDLYDAVESAGYSPVREDADDTDDGENAQDAARQAEIRRQRNLTLIGAAFTAPLLLFLAEKLFAPGILPSTIPGTGVSMGWIEFALATPVQ